MITTHTSTSAANTRLLGQQLAAELKNGDVIALFGDLGAGKTAFVQGLAQGLGIQETISSPTFALVNSHSGHLPLFHFDMYRITSWEDLESIGFYDYLNGTGIVAIEWSENIENALPKRFIAVTIEKKQDENTRLITIDRSRMYDDTSR